MKKFAKLNIEITISLKLSFLLSTINTIAISSNYWIKYSIDSKLHYSGLWQTCDLNGKCFMRHGIIEDSRSLWSISVHSLITLGALFNCLALVCLIGSAILKNIKKKVALKVVNLMDTANILLLISFALMLCGFCIFISTKCNYSLWLQTISIIFSLVSTNVLTRFFTNLYYDSKQNQKHQEQLGANVSTMSEQKTIYKY
jgi:hypothetical protein